MSDQRESHQSSGKHLDARDINAKNVPGSTAGAGSGDFHVYRHQRQAEIRRIHHMQQQARQEEIQQKHFKQIEQTKQLEIQKTLKKAEKRKKKKQLRLQRRKQRKQQQQEIQTDEKTNQIEQGLTKQDGEEEIKQKNNGKETRLDNE